MEVSSLPLIEQGLKVLDIEAQAILSMKNRIDDHFLKAVEMVHACKGKVIFTGIGKSGLIARKISSTMTSTGTPSMFLHPAEGAHGDLGIISQGDIVIGVSYGGSSPELDCVLKYVGRKNIPLIAMTGNAQSSLAKAAQILLNVQVSKEACPLGLAPTASSTATLAMGDALAMAVIVRRGFQPEDFAQNHPGGALGFRLLTTVKDVMHTGDAVPLVTENVPVREVLTIMTCKDVRGAAGVINPQGDLIGVVTDGDIRRRLEKAQDPLKGNVRDLMSLNPHVIDSSELVESALSVMEKFKIQMLFVVSQKSDNPRKPVGIIHIQDLLRSKVK